MSTDDGNSIELVRQALQVHINEAGADVDNGGWLITHYVCLVGLTRMRADGAIENRPILVSPNGQAAYVTNGLLGEGPDLLAQIDAFDAAEEIDED